MQKRIIQFFEEDIWKANVATLASWKALLLNILRTITAAVLSFLTDKCSLRAAALTYYSALTIVPMLALLFGIAKGFGLDERLKELLQDNLHGQEEALNRIIAFADALLERTRGELLAGVGMVIILWSVIRILGNIEEALNIIWRVKKSRTPIRKLTDYIALVIVGPVLIILSSSITVYIKAIVDKIIAHAEIIKPIYSFLLNTPIRILPYFIVSVLFTFVYLVIPNKKITPISAMIGGIIAGTLYQLVQWAYINFQVGVSNINAIYGSFAALPLFLIWVQSSWMIVLFGAEISYFAQNVHRFKPKMVFTNLDTHRQQTISIYILKIIVQLFLKTEHPVPYTDIRALVLLSDDFLLAVLSRLEQTGLIAKLENNINNSADDEYLPSKDIHTLTISRVLDILNHYSNCGSLDFYDKPISNISSILDKISDEAGYVTYNQLIKDL